MGHFDLHASIVGGGRDDVGDGNTYDGAKCNGTDYADSSTMAVSSASACQGAPPGIYDLSGNVSEWEDSCSANIGGNDTCRARGGAFISPQQPLRCDADQRFYRNAAGITGGYVGFRCCGP